MGTSLVLAQAMSADNAKVARAKADLTTLAISIRQFRIDCDRYPTQSEGLSALVMEPAKLITWRGPYLSRPLIMDPWGHPYRYKAVTQNGHSGFQVISYGADGKPGGTGANADLVDGQK